jgi:hypothetical protein
MSDECIDEVNSLFQQPWWLETLAPGRWDAVELRENGKLVARLPYVSRRRYGLTLVDMPPLTQTLGPWLRSSEGKYEARLSREHELLEELVARIPHCDSFRQSFHHSVTNWLPFYWAGYTQTTRYTYLLDSLGNLDDVWAAFRDKTRNSIRKAEKQGIIVQETDDVDLLLWLWSRTYARQERSIPITSDVVRRTAEASFRRAAGRLYVARDGDSRPHTAVLCVHDDRSCYYLVQGADPEVRDSGANALAVWHCIKQAAKTSRVFDFEGSMVPGIERFFRSFGARQTPYSYVWRDSRCVRVARSARELMRTLANGRTK